MIAVPVRAFFVGASVGVAHSSPYVFALILRLVPVAVEGWLWCSSISSYTRLRFVAFSAGLLAVALGEVPALLGELVVVKVFFRPVFLVDLGVSALARGCRGDSLLPAASRPLLLDSMVSSAASSDGSESVRFLWRRRLLLDECFDEERLRLDAVSKASGCWDRLTGAPFMSCFRYAG